MLRSGVEPDLMITDFLMPGMNGVALIEHATATAPDMQVLLITGYSTIAEGPGASCPGSPKPFRQADSRRRRRPADPGARRQRVELPGPD